MVKANMRTDLTWVTGSIKTSYRVYYPDGTSRYISGEVLSYEGRTIEDAIEYLVKSFREFIEDGGVQMIKLISVGGRRVDIIVQ